MNVNDRIALEIGRAVLAKIVAEAQRDEVVSQLQALQEQASQTEQDKGTA